MTQYKILKVKSSNSRLKIGNKNGTERTFNLSVSYIDNSNGETTFPHKFLLTETQVSKNFDFGNGLSSNVKFPKN